MNLQLAGALEDMKGVFKWPETVEQLAAVVKADVALSGDGIEKYRELLEALLAWHDDDSQTAADRLAFAVQALRSAKGGE